MIKLDYTITSPEERNELVKKILEEEEELLPSYLEILADYLVLCMEKQEKRNKKILTENRMTTVNKRETSFEGLVSQLENGEDGIYNLINENKQTLFQPKISITKNDLETLPLLKQLRETIETWEQRLKQVEGKDAFTIKKALIEMRKEQYLIKQAYQKPIVPNKLQHTSSRTSIDGVELTSAAVCEALLCNYSKLKEDTWDQLDSDLWCLLQDFENTCDKALKPYPVYQYIVEAKIDNLSNIEIQTNLQQQFGIKYSIEYISSLWRNKIPKLIASCAEDEYLYWYYLNVEKGHYKRCSRCGQIKLADNKYFSKNKTSKDHFYSICKECRNKKK